MELFKEWFLWGESDLFIYGIALIVFAAIFSGTENRVKNRRYIIVCLIIYAICELIVTFWFHNWTLGYISLFAGGIALSLSLGRMIKTVFARALKQTRNSNEKFK